MGTGGGERKGTLCFYYFFFFSSTTAIFYQVSWVYLFVFTTRLEEYLLCHQVLPSEHSARWMTVCLNARHRCMNEGIVHTTGQAVHEVPTITLGQVNPSRLEPSVERVASLFFSPLCTIQMWREGNTAF